MTVSDGDILKAVVSINMPLDVTAQNVFYFKVESAIDYSNSVVMTAIKTWCEDFYDTFAGSVKSTVELEAVEVVKWVWDAIDGWRTAQFVGIALLLDTFSSTGELMPHAVAAILSGSTLDPKVPTRKSIAGFTEPTMEASEIGPGSLAELANAATAWLTDKVLTGSDILVPGVPGKGNNWQDLLAVTVSSIVGSQRRRKPGVGI